MEWTTIATMFGFLIAGMVLPGPNNVTCAAHASLHGRRSNVPLIVGMATGYFSVNAICGLMVNAFDAEGSVGTRLHYFGSLFMVFLSVGIILIGRSNRISALPETIPKLGFKVGVGMMIVNTKQWMVMFTFISVFLTEYESQPGGIPGGYPGILIIATINTTVGLISMYIWSILGNRMHARIREPQFAKIIFSVMGTLLLVLSILLLLSFYNR